MSDRPVFIEVHIGGQPDLLDVSGIWRITRKLKGRGCIIIDHGGDSLEIDETYAQIKEALLELELEIIECSNDG